MNIYEAFGRLYEQHQLVVTRAQGLHQLLLDCKEGRADLSRLESDEHGNWRFVAPGGHSEPNAGD